MSLARSSLLAILLAASRPWLGLKSTAPDRSRSIRSLQLPTATQTIGSEDVRLPQKDVFSRSIQPAPPRSRVQRNCNGDCQSLFDPGYKRTLASKARAAGVREATIANPFSSQGSVSGLYLTLDPTVMRKRKGDLDRAQCSDPLSTGTDQGRLRLTSIPITCHAALLAIPYRRKHVTNDLIRPRAGCQLFVALAA